MIDETSKSMLTTNQPGPSHGTEKINEEEKIGIHNFKTKEVLWILGQNFLERVRELLKINVGQPGTE